MKNDDEEKRRTHEKMVLKVWMETKHTIECESSNSKTYLDGMK
jgi:hypothetical protein